MRVALHSVVREGREDGYDSTHATVPADLVASFVRIGIHDWTIWRSGRDLFHVIDCDDFEAAMAALASDPVNATWQDTIGPFVDHFKSVGPGEKGLVVPQVWRLKEQHGTPEQP